MRDLKNRIKRLEQKNAPGFDCVILHQDAGGIKHDSGLTFESVEAAEKHFRDAHVIVIHFV